MSEHLKRVLVDLRPVRPGGENGGAKIMAIELIRVLGELHPECEFVLLTSARAHNELSTLDKQNIRRVLTNGGAPRTPIAKRLAMSLPQRFPASLKALIPASLKAWVRDLRVQPTRSSENLILKELDVDLVFCPFTVPFNHQPGLPTVSVVYDLQHRYYPQFFSAKRRKIRDKILRAAAETASVLICISDFVRETVIAELKIETGRVHTVHIQLPYRLPQVPLQAATATLHRFGLSADCYLLYPANFWLHKNHEMLLTAYGMYVASHGNSPLQLVCTGAQDMRLDYLKKATRAMRLSSHVVFPGYLPDQEFAGLMANCKAVIFPSLYEGFGMPVLEAMAFGKPVLCSTVTSLPEVAGDAALLFNPKRPQEIIAAIRRIELDNSLVERLVEKGRRRAAKFGNARMMAEQYWAIFSATTRVNSASDSLHEAYADGSHLGDARSVDRGNKVLGRSKGN